MKLKVCNGVDDIDDNIAAVQLFLSEWIYNPVVAGVSLPVYEVGHSYKSVAVYVATEFFNYLKNQGFEQVKLINTVK